MDEVNATQRAGTAKDVRDSPTLFIDNIRFIEYTGIMDDNALDRQAKLFRALMHPARLAILDVLRDGEQCVCHMEATLGYRQAYVSQQLAVLREAGLVRDRRDGWNTFYWVTEPGVFTVLDAARAIVGGAETAGQPPNPATNCSCPKCAPLSLGVA